MYRFRVCAGGGVEAAGGMEKIRVRNNWNNWRHSNVIMIKLIRINWIIEKSYRSSDSTPPQDDYVNWCQFLYFCTQIILFSLLQKLQQIFLHILSFQNIRCKNLTRYPWYTILELFVNSCSLQINVEVLVYAAGRVLGWENY